MTKQRRTFSSEFKRGAATLVSDQGYSHIDASRSVGVGQFASPGTAAGAAWHYAAQQGPETACLMRELGLVSKQLGSHAYKQATIERPDIPNRLNREFDVSEPNQVWRGDITYIWANGHWDYLARVLDLHTRRVVGWAFSTKPHADLVIEALDMTYEHRDKLQGVMFHSD